MDLTGPYLILDGSTTTATFDSCLVIRRCFKKNKGTCWGMSPNSIHSTIALAFEADVNLVSRGLRKLRQSSKVALETLSRAVLLAVIADSGGRYVGPRASRQPLQTAGTAPLISSLEGGMVSVGLFGLSFLVSPMKAFCITWMWNSPSTFLKLTVLPFKTKSSSTRFFWPNVNMKSTSSKWQSSRKATRKSSTWNSKMISNSLLLSTVWCKRRQRKFTL